MKRIMAVMLAVLTVFACFPACALDGPWAAALKAGMNLLTGTGNVTVSLEATLNYQDQPFKTIRAEYALDGNASLLTLNKNSLGIDGGWHESASLTHVRDGVRTVIPNMNAAVFETGPAEPGAGVILTLNDEQTTQLGTIQQLMDLIDSMMGNSTLRAKNENGESILLKYRQGASIGVLDTLLLTLVRQAAAQYLGFHGVPKRVGENTTYTPYDYTDLSVEYWDWDEAYAQQYETLFGEQPEQVPDTSLERDEQVRNALLETAAEKASEWSTGIVLIQSDGNALHYVTYDDYVLAEDGRYILYENENEALKSFYRFSRREELPQEVLDVRPYTDNPQLLSRLAALKREMDAYYSRLLIMSGGTSFAAVYQNGRIAMYDSIALTNHAFESYTRQILWATSELHLTTADMICQLDSAGRMVSLSGTVALSTVNHMGTARPLTISVTLKAGQYGTTEVAPFDPEAYQVHPREDLPAPAEPEAPPVLPETVTFEGIVYPVKRGE